MQVENFTVAFSDGRVLCYLIHHYHPSLLPEEAVSHSTTQTVECSPRGRLELNCSASDSDSSFDSLPTGLNGMCQLCAVSSVQVSVWLHFLKTRKSETRIRMSGKSMNADQVVQHFSYNYCINWVFLFGFICSKPTCCLLLRQTLTKRVSKLLKNKNTLKD